MLPFSARTKKILCAVLAVINGLYPIAASAQSYFYLVPIPSLKIRTGVPLPTEGTVSSSNATSTTARAGSAVLKVSPSIVDFGQIPTGTSSLVQTLTLRNMGSEALVLGHLSVSSQFVVTDNCDGVALPALAECKINVTFAPTQTAAESVSGAVEIPFTAGTQSAVARVDLTGTPAQPLPGTSTTGTLEVSSPTSSDPAAPSSSTGGTPELVFDTAIINQQSWTKSFVLKSTGEKPLSFYGLSIAPDDGSFTATSDCPANVPVGSQCTISVVFAPKTVGVKQQVLTVSTSSFTGNDMQVNLIGEAVEVYGVFGANSTSQVSLGTVVQGSAPVTKTVTIGNSGTAPLTVGALTLSGSAAGLSIQGSTCSTPVPVNGTCTVTLVMSTATPTIIDAKLVVPHDGRLTPTSPVQIPVTGQVDAQTRVLSYSNPLDFGPTDINTTVTKDLVIKNIGNSPVSGVTVSAATPFTVAANGCSGKTLQPQDSCTVTFSLNYGTTGALSRSTTISATGLTVAAAPLSLTASMQTRTISAATPNSLAYGLQTSQAWSAERTVSVTNTSTVRVAPIVGGRNADGTLSGATWVRVSSDTCAAGVAPGQACTFGFQVKPLSSTAFSTTINIYPDVGLSTRQQTVSVSATGTTQSYTASVTSLDFGTVGSLQYVDKVITVTNTSPAGTAVTGLTTAFVQPTLSGAVAPGSLALQGNTCSGGNIPSSSSCTLTVRYTAPSYASTTAVTPTGGSFAFRFTGAQSYDTVLPAAISLVGSDVTVAVSSTDFGDVPANVLAAAAPRRVITLKNTGAYPVTYNSYVTDASNKLGLTEDTSVTGRCVAGSTLAAGASCTLTLYAMLDSTNPTAGAKSTTVTTRVTSLGNVTGVGSPIAFTGNAIAPTVSTSTTSIDFGTVGENTKVTKTFTFQASHGGQVYLPSGTYVTGTGYSLLAASPLNCSAGYWVAPGTVCTWTIQLDQKAYATATVTGKVQILSNANGQTGVPLASINLTANIERAALVVAYNDLNWGDVPTQTAGNLHYAVLKNNSTSAAVPFTGKTVATPFTISTDTSTYNYQGVNLVNCANLGTLNPSTSCYIAVSLSGAVGAGSAGVGPFNGPVTFTYSGADGSIAVPMTANFLQANPQVSASSVAFPNPTPSTTAHVPDLSITLNNNGGGRMYWGTASYNLTTTGDFYIVKANNTTAQSLNASPITNSSRCEEVSYLDPGKSCTLVLRFTPTGAGGAKSGTLTLATRSPAAATISVPLSGTAQAGVMSVTDTTVDFGKVVVGTSLVKSITIKNQGDGALALSNLQRIRADGVAAQYPTELTATHNCPASLDPGASCQVDLKLAPDQNFNWGSLAQKEAFQFKHYTNGAWVTTTIPLIGEGYGSILTASQHVHDLGFIEQAVVPKDYVKTVTFTASGPGSVRITSLNLATGAYLESYAGGTCATGLTLQSGDSCTLLVRNRADFSNVSTYPAGAFNSPQALFAINGTYYKDATTPYTDKSVQLQVTGTVVAPSTVVEVNPRAVSTQSSTPVSIFGTNFRTGVQVQLDGAVLSNTLNSATELRLVVPSGLSVGSHTLSIRNMDGRTSALSLTLQASAITVDKSTALDVYTAMYDRPVAALNKAVDSVVVLADGRKVALIGNSLYLYDANDHLLGTATLPNGVSTTCWAQYCTSLPDSYVSGGLSLKGSTILVGFYAVTNGVATSPVSFGPGGNPSNNLFELKAKIAAYQPTSTGFTSLGSVGETSLYYSSQSVSGSTPVTYSVDGITAYGDNTSAIMGYSYNINGTRTAATRLWTGSTAGTAYAMATQSGNVKAMGSYLTSSSAYVRWGDRIYTYDVSGSSLSGGASYQYAAALGADSAKGLAMGSGGADLLTSCYSNTSVCVIPTVGSSLGAAYLLAGSAGASTGYIDGAANVAQFNIAGLTTNSVGATVYQVSVPNATRVVKWVGSAPTTGGTGSTSSTGIVIAGSSRTWYDGTLASSCKGYLSGDASHTYAGATGDGTYRISLDGTPTDVYCDMTSDGGGWTLAMRSTPTGAAQPAMVTTSAVNVTAANVLSGSSFKFSDTSINSLKSVAYRVTSTGGYSIKRFFKPTCAYSTTVSATGDCNVSYASTAWDNAKVGGTLTGLSGLSDHNPSTNIMYLVTADTRLTNYGWFVGDGVTAAGYGAGYNYQAPSTLWLWVR